ncbi:MAG: rhomboid family intramembrane serine protease [Nitratireductor sp.]
MFIPLHDSNSLQNIKLQYVTLAIIIVNVGIWLITGTPNITNEDAQQALFISYGFIPSVANGFESLPVEYDGLPTSLTYLSYSFLHGDFMHLAGNMLFIWVFGDNIEDAMGHAKYLAFYLACAAAGAVGHSMLGPQSSAPLIGASGAAAGIIGAYLLLHPNVQVWILALGRIPLKIPAFIVLGFWIALQFYEIMTDEDGNVSFAAHIAGLIAGMILVVFLKKPHVKLFDTAASTQIEPQKETNFQEIPRPTSSRKTKQQKKSSASVPSIGRKRNFKD